MKESTNFRPEMSQKVPARTILKEANSPYAYYLEVSKSGTVALKAKVVVEEWFLDIGIEDMPGGNETLVTGPDETKITEDTLEIDVVLDNGVLQKPAFVVTENNEVKGGPAGNQRGSAVTPNYRFYTTPSVPYDIRYVVIIHQKIRILEVPQDGLRIEAITDGTLNPWDMDPTQNGRQLETTWGFGVDTGGKQRGLIEKFK